MTEGLDLLRSKKLFVLDMDGTFYLGDRLIEGSLEFLRKLGATGRHYLFFTNNSSRTRAYYKKKLMGMGCFVDEKDIVTSGDVTIKYLQQNYPEAGIYLVGTRLLEESFRQAGIKLTTDDPDVVVLSFDTSLTYDKVSNACSFIRGGAKFLATHLDLNCPTEDGFIPDCGSMCAMVQASTGVSPKYLGKPFRETVEMIRLITGCRKDEMAFVGDRLYTDIAAGVQNGITGILVLTGETHREDLAASVVQPDFIFESLSALGEAL